MQAMDMVCSLSGEVWLGFLVELDLCARHFFVARFL